jgi:hypothetical protein
VAGLPFEEALTAFTMACNKTLLAVVHYRPSLTRYDEDSWKNTASPTFAVLC